MLLELCGGCWRPWGSGSWPRPSGAGTEQNLGTSWCVGGCCSWGSESQTNEPTLGRVVVPGSVANSLQRLLRLGSCQRGARFCVASRGSLLEKEKPQTNKGPGLFLFISVYQPGAPVVGGAFGNGALFPWGPTAFPRGEVALAIEFTSSIYSGWGRRMAGRWGKPGDPRSRTLRLGAPGLAGV